MKKYNFNTIYTKILADVITPVNTYLKIRDFYPNSILLESNDSQSAKNCYSYICINPISHYKLANNKISVLYPDGKSIEIDVNSSVNVITELQNYIDNFEFKNSDLPFNSHGIYGYVSYDALTYFDKHEKQNENPDTQIPSIFYQFYKYTIAIDHFKSEAYLIENKFDFEEENFGLQKIQNLIQTQTFAKYPFKNIGDTNTNLSDKQFIDQVNKAIEHCKKGNVFQLVVSRQFQQKFIGDEFNVYRALRSINPSPYLFYFDYGNFKILGSSPEAQLVVKNKKAEIHPIAGTFKRTGNDESDAEMAKKLSNDPKENAEHIMLVDLARNDLSKNGKEVQIEILKQIQFFSHVIHLVSKVTSKLKNKKSTLATFVNTFPAGTLSGAPKHKAIQLINEIENTNRSFYGGAIGFIDFNGDFNHAIIIRSFLSKNHLLTFQAGAGVVESSNPELENQEVYNKLKALAKALKLAENI